MEATSLQRVRFENRVLAEMAELASSAYPYPDVVQAVLDLVESVVSSPFLSLSVTEMEDVGHYVRVPSDTDRDWAEEVEDYVREVHRDRMGRHAGPARREVLYHLAPPTAWMAAFSADSRSGRHLALTIGSPRPLSLEADEEGVMVRLARQSLLVLDQVLLLDEIDRLETSDTLTGLINHRRLLELLEYEIERHRFHQRYLGLLMIDVQGLRGINRSYGHQYGDHILSKVAGLLRETARTIDLVARCGMDEFVLVLPETDGEAVQSLAEDLYERLLALGFAGDAVELSVAAVHAGPEDNVTAEGLMRRAEQALHDTKRQEKVWQGAWRR